MRIRVGMTIAALATTAAVAPIGWHASQRPHAPSERPCAPARPYQPRMLADRVPAVMDAQLTPTRDGGMLIAFASYRGSREFPDSRFTVLHVDSAACLRWKASFRGGWPITRPVVLGSDTILLASDGRRQTPVGTTMRIQTLSASTGRVLRGEALAARGAETGSDARLLTDRRGDVAVVTAVRTGIGSPTCCGSMTVKLTRRAGDSRWTRQVIDRSGGSVPATATLQDGRMAVAYPRRGRIWVRGGTVAGRLAAPIEAGRLGGNFRGAAIAIGADGTIAAAWQSGTYSRPWRLRAAVRPSKARRFSRPRQLGFAAADHLTMFEGPAPALRVDAGGNVMVGFFAPTGTVEGRERVMCAHAARDGAFARPRPSADRGPADPGAAAAMVLGGPSRRR